MSDLYKKEEADVFLKYGNYKSITNIKILNVGKYTCHVELILQN